MKKNLSRMLAALLCMTMLLALAGTAFASVSVTPASGYVIATSAVNLRSGPSVDYSILAWIPYGGYAVVSGIAGNGWLQVTYGGTTGFVNPAYFDTSRMVKSGTTVPVIPATPVTPVTPAQPVVVPTVGQATVNATRLNLRSGPSTKYSVLAVLPYGQVVNTISRSGSWTQVQAGNLTGYVSSRYLSTKGTTATKPPSVVATTSLYYYATTSVNIRSGPGDSYPVIGYVNANQIVQGVGVYGNWIKIRVSNGSSYEAYVSSSYLIGYLYADAASRVTYPTCYNTGSYNYNYYGYYNWRGGCSSSTPYYCPVCRTFNASYVCPVCRTWCTRVNCNTCYNNCSNNCKCTSRTNCTCYPCP